MGGDVLGDGHQLLALEVHRLPVPRDGLGGSPRGLRPGRAWAKARYGSGRGPHSPRPPARGPAAQPMGTALTGPAQPPAAQHCSHRHLSWDKNRGKLWVIRRLPPHERGRALLRGKPRPSRGSAPASVTCRPLGEPVAGVGLPVS